jgi:hypothetical protein
MKIKKSTKAKRVEFAKIAHQCPNCLVMTTEEHMMPMTLEHIMSELPPVFACQKKEQCSLLP